MAMDRATGRLVAGRYELKERLGQGGMGVVWRATDTLLQRDVAVKTLQIPPVPDEVGQDGLRDKVLREAWGAGRLNHPGVVTVFDVVEEGGEPVIIMELVPSPNLAQLVRRLGPLPPVRAAAIGLEVLDALAAAHAQGILHRDVKPANIMVPEEGRVRLSDFGVAALLDDPRVTTSGVVAGSPSYMAPEQATGEMRGPAADLWSLGASLYFAVEGEPPFDRGGAIATMTSIVHDEPRPYVRAAQLGPVLDALLVKDPDARPGAEAMRRLLTEVLPGPAERGADGTGVPRADGASPSPASTWEGSQIASWPLTAAEAAPVVPGSPVAEEVDKAERVIPSAPARAPSVRRRRLAVPLGLALTATLALVVALLVSMARKDDRSPSRAPTKTGAGVPAVPPGTPASTVPPGTPASTARRTSPSKAPTGQAVPGDWVAYTDPPTRFSISHPAGWGVRTRGTLTDFTDPVSGAYLRVDHVEPPGPSPEGAWLDYEPKFAAGKSGYQRIQITPTTYKGFDAAIWEFTYGEGAGERHAVDLGFITGRYGFALNFQTRSADWERFQPVFEKFKASFEAPRS
jgi:eukaryotic-like serine/threonine-protein kinase